jgi:hypothetical protein
MVEMNSRFGEAIQPLCLKSDIRRSPARLPPMPRIILKAREPMANPSLGLRDLDPSIRRKKAGRYAEPF